MGIKFDGDSLVVEKEKHATKIVDAYILYELHAWPDNPVKNFTLKIACLEQLIL